MIYRSQIKPGKGRGKLLGFPTFNVEIPQGFSEQEGIYACKVFINNQAFRGALHYGPIPVYKESEPSLEIFVLDYSSDDLRIESLGFELMQYLRPVQNFSGPEKLAAQMSLDIEEVRKLNP